MNEFDLKERFLRFALNVYRLTQKFPKESVYFMITNQVLRSSSSPGANYRAACLGKSGPDFINKLKIVEEELDESIYWFQYTNGVDPKWITETYPLKKECSELLAITVSSIKTRRKSLYKKS